MGLVKFLTNQYIWVPLLASLIAQLIKFTIHWAKERRPNFTLLVQTGGMPSSHSASVSALSTLVGAREGLDSPLFGVVAFFSLLIMYDAAGLRREAGRQAAVLNVIVRELMKGHPVSQESLRELLGHTPIEVLAGALLGIAIALLFVI